jgi:hypothetical protein
MKPNVIEIEQIKKNLFFRSQDSILDYNLFDWHSYNGKIDSNKSKSSQAVTIDFWGCLKLSPNKNQIINKIFNKNCDNWELIFEFTDKNILAEKKPTQIDVLIESESYVIIIESKFAETNGGTCSQTKKSINGKSQCNGNYELQHNYLNGVVSKCALTGKGISYWNYINTLTKFKESDTYFPCPFKDFEFQWMRNICFSDAYASVKNKIGECYLVYYNSDKFAISKKVKNGKYLGSLMGQIHNSSMLAPLSYNELIDQIIDFLDLNNKIEKQVWVDLKRWLVEKEKNIGNPV